MSILLWATIITLPKPLSPVNHSPTTAPIIESGKDIRNAANKYGNAEGILKWIIISHSEAFKVLRKSNLLELLFLILDIQAKTNVQ